MVTTFIHKNFAYVGKYPLILSDVCFAHFLFCDKIIFWKHEEYFFFPVPAKSVAKS